MCRGSPRSRRGQALRRRESCETNPISPGRRWLTEEIVQNKAKLGKTGVCGQRQSLRGVWRSRGVKRAKRTQFRGRRPPGLRIGDCGLQIERCRAGTPNPRSGRGQALRRAETCKTNPIWGATMESQVPYGKELRNDSLQNGRRKTKPICGFRADVGERASGTMCPGASTLPPTVLKEGRQIDIMRAWWQARKKSR